MGDLSPLLATASLVAVWGALGLALLVDFPAARFARILALDHGQKLAFAVAFVATAGSLYYSEIEHFVPCEFCWYQRIAMYPLAALLLVGVVTRHRLPARYIVMLAGAGFLISAYHYQLQLFPEQKTTCTVGVPCTVQFVNQFGFASIPFMAGSGFLSILLIQLAAFRARRLLRLSSRRS